MLPARIATLAICVAFSMSVAALDTESPLSDPEQIELYEGLIDEVRCLVCQNQTIGDSNAPLAKDLRREIREQVADGKSERDIKEFLTARYGDFVLYKPPLEGPALLLWLAPAILLLAAIAMLIRSLRRRAQLPVPTDHEDSAASERAG
ncbi:MAG: cytochrome c-type biogenesis protein [Gammaproteobacteria bacterium]